MVRILACALWTILRWLSRSLWLLLAKFVSTHLRLKGRFMVRNLFGRENRIPYYRRGLSYNSGLGSVCLTELYFSKPVSVGLLDAECAPGDKSERVVLSRPHHALRPCCCIFFHQRIYVLRVYQLASVLLGWAMFAKFQSKYSLFGVLPSIQSKWRILANFMGDSRSFAFKNIRSCRRKGTN